MNNKLTSYNNTGLDTNYSINTHLYGSIKYTEDGYLTAVDYPSPNTIAISNINTYHEKMPRTISILNLWKNKMEEDFKKDYERRIEYEKDTKIYNEILSLLEDFEDKYEKEELEKFFNHIVEFKITSNEEKRAIETYKTIYDKKLENLKNLFEEIKTMLLPCNSYEQEMEILKTYEVVTKEGRLNI